jgi:hypothetical protein
MRRWRKLKRHGVRRPRLVIREARRARLPLPNALAMLEQETGIPQRNVFGCDWGAQGGNPPYCGDPVTRKRVRKLIRLGKANGVGWTQLTYMPFVLQAQQAGGAWKPKYQMRVGFKVLGDLIRANGIQGGHQRYNGSGPAAEAYGRRAVELAKKWRSILS